MNRSDVAVVVIGRNEGDRLGRCLGSTGGWRTVYVDSGSTDGSADKARAADAEVIELDVQDGFTAARGRNAGLDRVLADPATAYIQMLDGDSALEPDWISAGIAALEANPRLGAVFGVVRERDRDKTIYGWMYDLEWAAQPDRHGTFGGSVLLRAAAVRSVGRYRDAMIAGEDFEFALRCGAAGWSIGALPDPMTVHDGAMERFGQWWRRAVRHGHAVAQLHAIHRRPAFARQRLRILFWSGCVPALALVGLLLTALDGPRWLFAPALSLVLVIWQFGRIALRESRRHGIARGTALAMFLTVWKYAEMLGLLRYHWSHIRGRRPELIEYKNR